MFDKLGLELVHHNADSSFNGKFNFTLIAMMKLVCAFFTRHTTKHLYIIKMSQSHCLLLTKRVRLCQYVCVNMYDNVLQSLPVPDAKNASLLCTFNRQN